MTFSPTNPCVSIAGRAISADHPPLVIAEMSGNHNGDLSRALKIIDMAKEMGADAVKLQTYRADTITINHDHEDFIVRGGLWDGKHLYELYEQAHTPWEWHETLFNHAKDLGLLIFSSPFDHTAIDFLEALKTPAYKIASFEIVDIPLIEKAASTGKPLIMSTGMASLNEIEEAVVAAENVGSGEIVLLHCVSGYPSTASEANLRSIADLANRFGKIVGLSDHSLGTGIAITAVGLGASVIEKHVTLDRLGGGPDDAFSLEPDELKALCNGVREAWTALGSVERVLKPSEIGPNKHRRSLYIVEDVRAGDLFTEQNIRSIRPAMGIAPKHLAHILGKRARCDIPRGTPMTFDYVSDPP
jgi:pseudaminic acid synthase